MTKKFWIFMVVGLVGLSLAGYAIINPVEKSSDILRDEAAIRGIFDRYADCIVRNDADGWMALWDEGGAQLPPESPMFVGKPEVRRGNYGWLSDRSMVWTMEILTQEVKVFPSEGYAFARGVYDWTCTPAGGGDGLCYDGKFMTIFRRQADGTWLIFRDCFNSNTLPGETVRDGSIARGGPARPCHPGPCGLREARYSL